MGNVINRSKQCLRQLQYHTYCFSRSLGFQTPRRCLLDPAGPTRCCGSSRDCPSSCATRERAYVTPSALQCFCADCSPWQERQTPRPTPLLIAQSPVPQPTPRPTSQPGGGRYDDSPAPTPWSMRPSPMPTPRWTPRPTPPPGEDSAYAGVGIEGVSHGALFGIWSLL